METMIWYAIEKTLPPLSEEMNEYEKELLEKLENELLSVLDPKQQDMFENFKSEYDHVVEELIYRRSGFVFSYGLKCGIEMQDCFDEIDKKL